MTKMCDTKGATYITLLIRFLEKGLTVNRKEDDLSTGNELISLIIALFENMQGKLDNELPQLLTFLSNEVAHQQHLKDSPLKEHSVPYLSFLLQAVSMAFTYNS